MAESMFLTVSCLHTHIEYVQSVMRFQATGAIGATCAYEVAQLDITAVWMSVCICITACIGETLNQQLSPSEVDQSKL